MSRFLLLVCLTLGLVVTGCGGDKDKSGDKDTQKTTGKDKKGSGEKGSGTTGTDEKKPEEKKPEEKAEEKKPEEKKPEEKKASVEKADDAQLVSLKLPNMT